jgi:hypothetical protein
VPRTVDIEVLSPVRGLHYEQPAIVIPQDASPNMQNVRLFGGIVQPAPGYDNFGTLNTLLGTPQLITQYVENDGDVHLLAFTTKYIYEYNAVLNNWGNIVSRQALLADCDTVWTASLNVTAATEGTIKVKGTNSAKLSIGAAFTTGLAAFFDFGAVNTTTYTHVHFWIRSTIATSAGDLRIAIDDTAGSLSPLTYYSVPALAANTWTQVEVAIGAGANAAVVSIGLDVVTDLGAYDVYIDNIIAVDRHTGTEDNRWSVTHYLDKLYATNLVDPIQVKDHSSNFDDWAEAAAAGYRSRIVLAFRNHLTMGYMIEGGVEFPQRFRWTDSGAVTFGGTAGSTETEGPDQIMNVLPLGNKAVIYKEESIVIVTHIGGNTVYRFDRTVANSGVIAQDLVLGVGELHIYVASDDIYYYAGGSDPVPIGEPVRDEFFRVVSDTNVPRAFSYYSAENQEVYLFVPSDGATSANFIWTYNVTRNTWSLRKKTGMSAIGAFNTSSGLTFGDAIGSFDAQTLTFGDRTLSSTAPIILYGTTDGVVGQIDATTFDDLGAAIDKVYDTSDFSASRLPIEEDAPVRFTDNTKRWLRFAFEARGTAVDILYSKNEGSTFTSVKTVALTDVWKRYFVSIDVPSDRIRFRFRTNAVAGAFYLRWYSVAVIGRSEV